jgi:flagellin
MGLRIATNIASINGQRQLSNTKTMLDSNFERLASGSRINRSGDDAAGLAIAENLKAQIRGMRQAKRNAQDGISLIQISEGALNEISSILIRLRELSVQCASDTLGEVERGFSDREFQSLKSEIDRIANVTQFNSIPLLNGQVGVFEIQVGTHNNPLIDRILYDGTRADATVDNLRLSGESVATKQAAQLSISNLDTALVHVNSLRSDMGALQNRLQSAINSNAIAEENVSAAFSRIKDADIAQEISEMTKNNILLQTGIAVLAHTNNTASAALKLIS